MKKSMLDMDVADKPAMPMKSRTMATKSSAPATVGKSLGKVAVLGKPMFTNRVMAGKGR